MVFPFPLFQEGEAADSVSGVCPLAVWSRFSLSSRCLLGVFGGTAEAWNVSVPGDGIGVRIRHCHSSRAQVVDATRVPCSRR